VPRKIVDMQTREKLDAKAKRAIERHLEWPYNGMVSDITSGIQGCCNYLVALGLICYSEMCGRQWFFNGDPKAENHECLIQFLKYMGAGRALQKIVNFEGKRINFSDAIRNGLVHEYFLKSRKGSVSMTSSHAEAKETGFYIPVEDEVHIVVVPYFNLFCCALQKAQNEGILRWKR
jgi:hypothetical protein